MLSKLTGDVSNVRSIKQVKPAGKHTAKGKSQRNVALRVFGKVYRRKIKSAPKANVLR